MKTAIKNWKEVFNTVTKATNYTMNGKLIRITSDVRENENGTQYRLCEIQVPHPSSDDKIITTAQIYEKNFAYGVEEGQSYLVTANPAVDPSGKTRLYFAMSHLQGSATPVMLEDLGLSLPVAKELETAAE